MKVRYEMDVKNMDFGEILSHLKILSSMEMDLGIAFEVIIKRGV